MTCSLTFKLPIDFIGNMKNPDLSTLSIKILLKCNVQPLSMHDVTQLYKSHKKDERDEVIKHLLSDQYIEAIKMPKPNTRKTPTYYLITKKGMKWVQNYLDSFPKK